MSKLQAVPTSEKDSQAPKVWPKISDCIKNKESGNEIEPKDELRLPKSEWVISIEKKLQETDQDRKACSLGPYHHAKHCIYRIPHNLKDGKNKAYVPQIVSLGPYHHGKKRLCQMDRHKWRCLRRVLQRTNHKIARYLDSVKEVEEIARSCYEGMISMNIDEFVEMMVLDGCFVIELFWGAAEGFPTLGYPHDDPVFSMRGLHNIQRDMIMLENQIPLFILDRLLNLQLGNRPDLMGHVANLGLQFFERMKLTDWPLTNFGRNRLEFDQGKLHCLDLFRWSLLHPGPKQEGPKGSSQKRQKLVHCVTELRKAGIKFMKGKTDKFWDIQFKDGILWIPQLQIDDRTWSIFLNVMAFEQCHFNCNNDMTSYIIFMDNLINSAEDVGHLHDCEIIEHWLGSDAEVANLFNQLCKEVVFEIDGSYLSKVSEDVNTYSSHRWNGWMATLRLKYFSNPWSIISLIAAFILLVLTLAQTFYGVYGYYKPRS